MSHDQLRKPSLHIKRGVSEPANHPNPLFSGLPFSPLHLYFRKYSLRTNGAPTGQPALSPGQRPGFLYDIHSIAPTGQKPLIQWFMLFLPLIWKKSEVTVGGRDHRA